MEEEYFLSGYCRQLDSSRTVTIVLDGTALTECDCGYPGCLYAPSCPIAEQIREKSNK